MKRLIYCLDGTWNKYDAAYPTNVVILEKSTADVGEDGAKQIKYYDPGVGTAVGEKFLGGALGLGLLKNIMQAYKHLCENFKLGDEIYIFGFSRGAYTARSFAGLIKLCGIIEPNDGGEYERAKTFYRKRKSKSKNWHKKFLEWRASNSIKVCADEEDQQYRKTLHADPTSVPPIATIRYVGVWDTVKTIGLIPKLYDWHDHSLSKYVEHARHAIAIDERRSKFKATEWSNIGALNKLARQEGRSHTKPYEQKWFPGGHGSVGGGGPVRGLSDDAFEWIFEGARNVGLAAITSEDAQVFSLHPNPLDWLDNSVGKKVGIVGSFFSTVIGVFKERDRPGPSSLDNVSHSTKVRYFADQSLLPEQQVYRPKSLNQVSVQMEQEGAPFDEIDYRGLLENAKANELRDDEEKYVKIKGTKFLVHVVKKGESLSLIAKKYSGNVMDYKKLHEVNSASITNPNLIYVNQRILIPENFIKK